MSADQGSGRSASMRFIMVAVLIDMIGIGLIIPVLPMLVGSFTASPAEQAWGYGAVAMAFALANFWGSAVLGALSDRYGRRPVLLIGFVGLSLSFVATALATSLWALVTIRFLAGALTANASVANAYVADISSPQEKARRFGMLGAMFGLGFILGPALGGWLGSFDLKWPFLAAALAGAINAVYGYFVLPESLPLAQRRDVAWWRANPVSSLIKLRRLGLGGLSLVVAMASLSQFVLHAVWVLYTHFRFGWGALENGWSFFAVGVASVVVQGFLLPRMLKQMGARRLTVLALSSGAFAYLLWGLAWEGWMMYAIIVLNLFGFSAAAAIQSIISNAAAANVQGETLGAVSSLNRLMAVLAPGIGSALLAFVSHLPADDWRLGMPFYICSVLQLLAAGMAWRYFQKRGGLRESQTVHA